MLGKAPKHACLTSHMRGGANTLLFPLDLMIVMAARLGEEGCRGPRVGGRGSGHWVVEGDSGALGFWVVVGGGSSMTSGYGRGGGRGGDGPALAAAVQPIAEAKQSESAIDRLGLDNRWMVTGGEGEKEGKRKVKGDDRWFVGGTTRAAGRGRGQETGDGGRPHKKVLRDSFI